MGMALQNWPIDLLQFGWIITLPKLSRFTRDCYSIKNRRRLKMALDWRWPRLEMALVGDGSRLGPGILQVLYVKSKLQFAVK
jgi:hypothetical protein